MMNEYRVKWEIDITAKSAKAAAKKALKIQRRKDSIATVFNVALPDGVWKEVDLG